MTAHQDLVARISPRSTGKARNSGFRRIAIVTPVLDDWPCFVSLANEISAHFTGSGIEFLICAVDDGSVTSFEPSGLALPAHGCISSLEILRLAVNLGHQRAIAVGLCAVADRDGLDAVVVMDSDGEDRPADIAALIEAGRHHPDQIVLARRAKRSESFTFRLFYRLYRCGFHALTGHDIDFGNYCLLPMKAVRRLVHMPELWNNLAASILRSRLICVRVPTIRGARYDGQSRMSLISLIVHGLSAMSVHIDRIFVRVLLGSGVIGIASILGILLVSTIRFMSDLAIPGWATTVAGDLLIILLQTVVLVVAATLMMLAGRSNRPMIPLLEASQFISERETHSPPEIFPGPRLPRAV
jgi:hypothetical protein